MGLLPLEFTDCLTDSPYFRENLHAHEKELERTSQAIKSLTKDVKELMGAARHLSRAQRSFGQSLMNFKFECIGSNQTDDEIIIARSLKEIGHLILQIEDERARMLDASESFITPLENFRKENIGEAKEGKKKFEKETAKFCQSLERYLNLSTKKSDNQLQEADATLEMEQRHFFQASHRYIFLLQEVQERKKFEFVETILGFMYAWLTFYHQGHEVGKDFKSFMTDLQIRIQKTRDNFNETRDQAETLMKKNLEVRKTPQDPGSLNKMYTRQGYLFLLEKKALGTGWTKHFCQYQKENKRFTMIPYSQNAGKITSTETMVLKTCVRRPSDSIDKRFCFDITTEDKPGFYTLQALSDEDRRLWMDAMDGKEPTYQPPGRLTKQEESSLDSIGFSFVKKCISVLEQRGLEDQGLYRIVGVSSKVQKLNQLCLDKKQVDKISLDDPQEWETKTITSSMKTYFRNLPEPVMTYKFYQDFIAAAKQEKKSERVNSIHILIHRLPQPNFEMLDLLMKHLCNVSNKSEKNLMTVSNLGVCLGPTLLRSEEETMAAIMDIKFCNIVVEILIEYYEKIFKSLPPEGFMITGGMNSLQVSAKNGNSTKTGNGSLSPSRANNGGTHAIITSFMTDVPMSVQIPGVPPPPSVVTSGTSSHQMRGSAVAMPQQPVPPARLLKSTPNSKQPLSFVNPTCRGDAVMAANNKPNLSGSNATTNNNNSGSSSESLSIASSKSSNSHNNNNNNSTASIISSSSKGSYSGRPSTYYQKNTRPDYLGLGVPSRGNNSSHQTTGRKVRTLYACVGANDSELTFEPNQLIENVKPSRDPGWLEGTLCGKTGLIPANYVNFVKVDDDPT